MAGEHVVKAQGKACIEAEFWHPSWKQVKGISWNVVFKTCPLFQSNKWKMCSLHFSSSTDNWHQIDKGVSISPEQQMEHINIPLFSHII